MRGDGNQIYGCRMIYITDYLQNRNPRQFSRTLWWQGQGLEVRGKGQGLVNWSTRTRTFLENSNTALASVWLSCLWMKFCVILCDEMLCAFFRWMSQPECHSEATALFQKLWNICSAGDLHANLLRLVHSHVEKLIESWSMCANVEM